MGADEMAYPSSGLEQTDPAPEWLPGTTGAVGDQHPLFENAAPTTLLGARHLADPDAVRRYLHPVDSDHQELEVDPVQPLLIISPAANGVID
jgi:hypothetical protein